MGIIGVTIWAFGVINLRTKSPDPPSTVDGGNLAPPDAAAILLNTIILGTLGGARFTPSTVGRRKNSTRNTNLMFQLSGLHQV